MGSLFNCGWGRHFSVALHEVISAIQFIFSCCAFGPSLLQPLLPLFEPLHVAGLGLTPNTGSCGSSCAREVHHGGHPRHVTESCRFDHTLRFSALALAFRSTIPACLRLVLGTRLVLSTTLRLVGPLCSTTPSTGILASTMPRCLLSAALLLRGPPCLARVRITPAPSIRTRRRGAGRAGRSHRTCTGCPTARTAEASRPR